MKNVFKDFIALVVAGFISAVMLAPGVVSAEEDTRTPEERYQGDYLGAWLLCALEQKKAFLEEKARQRGISLDGEKSDVSACIENGLKKVKVGYNEMRSLVKNAEGLEALKDHYVAAILHVRGTHANIGEDDDEFMARMNETKKKTDELWVRFEITQP